MCERSIIYDDHVKMTLCDVIHPKSFSKLFFDSFQLIMKLNGIENLHVNVFH